MRSRRAVGSSGQEDCGTTTQRFERVALGKRDRCRYSILAHGRRIRGADIRPLARAPDDKLREEDPARRRHLRRGRGEVTPQRSGLSARLRGSGPQQREPPRRCERVAEARCVGARKRRRARGREGASEREKEREGGRRRSAVRAAASSKAGPPTALIVLSSPRREARTRMRDRERSLASLASHDRHEGISITPGSSICKKVARPLPLPRYAAFYQTSRPSRFCSGPHRPPILPPPPPSRPLRLP